MWCPNCQKDSDVSSSADAMQLRCQNCGHVLSGQHATQDSLREARDILARWSSSSLLDEISALPQIPPLPGSDTTTGQTSNSEDQARSSESASDPSQQPQLRTPPENQSVAPQASAATTPPAKPITQPPDKDDHEATTSVSNSHESAKARETNPQSATDSSAKKTQASGDDPQTGRPAASTSETETETGGQDGHDADKAARTKTSEVKATANRPPPDDASGSDHSPHVKQWPQHEPAPESSASIQQPAAQSKRRAVPRPPQPRRPVARRSIQEKKPVKQKIRLDTPDGQSVQLSSDAAENAQEPQGVRSNSQQTGRRYRIDDGEPVPETVATTDGRARTRGRHKTRYIDDAHESARGPHFEIVVPKRSSLTTITGQFLAYLGVLGLTIGTCVVIYGHFSGAADITPTGWLVTTVAQMMLFLGIINLVSGGIEKTNDEVSARINYIGEQLMRIEQTTEAALRGPKISAHRYANPDAEVPESTRATVPVNRND